MLLAQIKSGYSSTDPSSTDPSSTDPSSADEASELERETEQKQEAEEQEGEDDDKETSDSDADICASKASGRHRLLRAKLCLTVGTTPGRRAAGQGTTPGQTEGNSSEGEESRSSSEPWAVSESLSESEGEESQSKRTRSRNNAWEDDQRSYLQKKRRRLLQLQDCTGGDQSSSGVGEDEGEDSIASPKGRKKIRRIMGNDHLRFETQNALKEEEDRRKRLAEREQEQRERLREVTVIGNTPEDPCQVTPKLVLDEDPGSKEPLVQVHTHLVTKLKPHQVDGVQFIWDCCCETTEKAQKSTGSGCILAHCMGLGKTLQVVTFLHTVLRCENLNFKTALVVCPLNTVLNWLYEFDKWQEGMLDGESVQVSELVTVRRPQERSEALQRWQKAGGVMIISYETYRNLTQGKKTSGQSLRTVFLSTLVNPGPDFVICDEGHVLKNQCTAISRAMSSVRTRRRVVLTGTPLQNNLAEYHCMVNFIKENLLGSIKEFRNRFINPILNGQCADSTPSDVRLMKKRAHILYEMLAGCVQRRDYTTLTRILPPKHEYVLAIRVSPLQYKLYIYYLDHFSSVKGGRVQPGNRLFKDFQVLSRILAHPWCVELAYISKENKGHFDGSSSEKSRTWETSESSPSLGSDEDEKVKRVKRRSERVTGQWDSGAVEVPEESSGHSRGGNPVGSCDVRRVGEAKAFSRLRPGCSSPGWHKEFVTEADSKVLEHSGKMVLLFEILRMAEEVGDKVLVFSQSLISLDIIEDFLELAGKEEEHLRYKGKGAWSRNRDYYRLDGSTGAATRKRWADDFNDSSNKRGRLFLISTRAGSLGINLVAANRVIIFDASWNPSHDIQSIFRVYRFGQLKPVFVYRFLAQGTMEEKIYGRQVAKQSLSFRVVDKQQIQRHFTMNELAELYHFRPDRLDQPKSVGRRMQRTWILPKDPFLAELLHSFKEQIVGYHEHDSLLDHKEEEALSVEERTAAWAEYEAEKKGLSLTMNLLTYSNMIYEGSKQHYMVNIAALKTMTATQLQELINQGREKVKQASDALELLSNQRVGASLADSLWNVKPQQGQSLAVAQESSMKAELKRREAVYRSTLQKQQVLEMCIQKMELDRKMQPTVMKEGTTAN